MHFAIVDYYPATEHQGVRMRVSYPSKGKLVGRDFGVEIADQARELALEVIGCGAPHDIEIVGSRTLRSKEELFLLAQHPKFIHYTIENRDGRAIYRSRGCDSEEAHGSALEWIARNIEVKQLPVQIVTYDHNPENDPECETGHCRARLDYVHQISALNLVVSSPDGKTIATYAVQKAVDEEAEKIAQSLEREGSFTITVQDQDGCELYWYWV